MKKPYFDSIASKLEKKNMKKKCKSWSFRHAGGLLVSWQEVRETLMKMKISSIMCLVLRAGHGAGSNPLLSIAFFSLLVIEIVQLSQ